MVSALILILGGLFSPGSARTENLLSGEEKLPRKTLIILAKCSTFQNIVLVKIIYIRLYVNQTFSDGFCHWIANPKIQTNIVNKANTLQA